MEAASASANAPEWIDVLVSDPQPVVAAADGALPSGDDANETQSTDGADALSPNGPQAQAVDVRDSNKPSPDPEPSFLRKPQADSVWRRPAVRIALIVLLLALLALLGAQLLIKERDRVAALEPATRPLLLALCAVSGCSLSPLRQIDSIVIDSSSFSQVRGDDYRLGFSLKNTAPIDVAMPAIELALTDPQDQPLIRRVILPAEFGAQSPSLASASVWTGSLALNVQPGANADRISGYRLLAFYP